MRKLLTALAIGATLTGCTLHRFEIGACEKLRITERDDDCQGGWRRSVQTHCLVTDTKSGCRVGALRYDNPKFHQMDSWGFFDGSEYQWARLYDWECPSGVAPPSWRSFRFVEELVAPMACDDKGDPLPSNPLLRPKRPAPINSGVSSAGER